MKKVVEYIARYDAGFPARIRGAEPFDVDRLERLAGCVLPRQYREFLETMGADAGGLEFSNDDAMTIGEIVQYYEEKERGEAEAPLKCVVIAWGGSGYEEQQLSMLCNPGDDPGRGARVLVSSGAQIVGVYADSLEGLLLRRAFEQYRVLSQRVRGVYAGRTMQQELVHAAGLAEGLAFHSQPFSDSVAFCGEREDGLVVAMDQLPHRGLSIRIAGKSKAGVRDTGVVFEQKLGVSFSHW